MEPDGDSADSIESFFSSLQSSEHSPRNLSQIFEDDLLPMQRESRNLRYQPGGHRAQQPQKPLSKPQPPPTPSPAVSSERNSVVAVVEKTPSRWSVAFAKIVNIYNGYHPAERMCLALTMLGENEAATMILYKQKTQTISNTKLKPNGKTVHFRDNYVQFYDDTRKYWSLRFVQKADEEGFVQTMTTNGWPLEQHSSRSEDDVELPQQQQQQEEEEEHSSGSQQDVEHPQQNTEQLSDPTEELLLSDQTSEQFMERIEQKQQQLREQLRDQLMERLNREQLERNERYGKLHSEQNREQLREPNREQHSEQNREQLREPNRDQHSEQLRESNREQHNEQNREQQDLRNREQRVEQIREQLRQETRELLMEQNREQLRRENPAEHQEPRRHTCYHHRHSRNNNEHPEVPPQPMPRSRNLATSQDELGEKSSKYMECLRRHFMHLGCEHMQSARGQIPEEDLSSERMQSGREPIPDEDLSSEHMQSVREQISEEDVIVTPMSIPIGSTSSRTSMEHHRSNSSAVVQLPARRAETTNSSSRLLAKFINTHMGPGEIAEMKIQNILDAMQRLSEGHGRNFNGNHNEDAPQPQPRPSSKDAEDAEDRVLQLEQSLLDAKKENRRLSKELKMRDEDLLSFQKSSLALMEKLITTNEDLTAKNSRLVETIIITKSKASKKENCINCERSAQEIVVLKRHIDALELALRESE